MSSSPWKPTRKAHVLLRPTQPVLSCTLDQELANHHFSLNDFSSKMKLSSIFALTPLVSAAVVLEPRHNQNLGPINRHNSSIVQSQGYNESDAPSLHRHSNSSFVTVVRPDSPAGGDLSRRNSSTYPVLVRQVNSTIPSSGRYVNSTVPQGHALNVTVWPQDHSLNTTNASPNQPSDSTSSNSTSSNSTSSNSTSSNSTSSNSTSSNSTSSNSTSPALSSRQIIYPVGMDPKFGHEISWLYPNGAPEEDPPHGRWEVHFKIFANAICREYGQATKEFNNPLPGCSKRAYYLWPWHGVKVSSMDPECHLKWYMDQECTREVVDRTKFTDPSGDLVDDKRCDELPDNAMTFKLICGNHIG